MEGKRRTGLEREVRERGEGGGRSAGSLLNLEAAVKRESKKVLVDFFQGEQRIIFPSA